MGDISIPSGVGAAVKVPLADGTPLSASELPDPNQIVNARAVSYFIAQAQATQTTGGAAPVAAADKSAGAKLPGWYQAAYDNSLAMAKRDELTGAGSADAAYGGKLGVPETVAAARANVDFTGFKLGEQPLSQVGYDYVLKGQLDGKAVELSWDDGTHPWNADRQLGSKLPNVVFGKVAGSGPWVPLNTNEVKDLLTKATDGLLPSDATSKALGSLTKALTKLQSLDAPKPVIVP